MFTYVDYDPSRYATFLIWNHERDVLTWESAQGIDGLIVKTPYGRNATEYMEAICHALPVTQGKYVEIQPGVQLRLASAAEGNCGCPIAGKASTYTIFACSVEEGKIYKPKSSGDVRCDIPLKLTVDVDRLFETRKTGFLGLQKRQLPTDFYEITFPAELSADYHDGDLSYKTGNFQIPVSRRMLEAGTVYIKSPLEPRFISANEGLILV